MRIVHVNGEKGFSGGEVQMFHLMEYLREQGDECLLVGREGGAALEEARSRGFAAHSLPMRSSLDLAAIFALRRLFRSLAPQVLHFHTSRAHVLGAWAALGLPGTVRVATRRMDYPLRRDPVTRFLYGGALDGVVAISQAVRAEVLRLGIPQEKVFLVPSGVEAGRFRPLLEAGPEEKRAARSALGLPEEGLFAGSAATHHPRKGLDVLLEAAALLKEKGREFFLLLAGTGPAGEELKKQAREAGLGERVFFPGRVAPSERIYAVLDVFCLPSRKEGLGVAALEAMASGLPVLASRVGGLAESVLDGETGILVPPGDPAALAEGLDRLLADGELRRRMGRAGAARVAESYTARAMGEGNRRIYLDLLEGRKQGGTP